MKIVVIKIYRNKKNKNKYIEVHNDGYYHNTVKQYMYWTEVNVKNLLGDKKLHRWRKGNLTELLEDYEEVQVMYMHVHTIEENYEYRMKNIIKALVKDYGLNELNPEELQYKIWTDYAKEFAHAVLQDMVDFSGDELFEVGE